MSEITINKVVDETADSITVTLGLKLAGSNSMTGNYTFLKRGGQLIPVKKIGSTCDCVLCSKVVSDVRDVENAVFIRKLGGE